MPSNETQFTNLRLTTEIIGSELLSADQLAGMQESDLVLDAVQPVGLEIRGRTYLTCLSELATLRAQERATGPIDNKTWRPSLDQGMELRESMQQARKDIEILNNIDDYVRREQHVGSLFDDQVTLFDQMIGVINDAKRMGDCDAGVVAATGIGKTHLMIEALRAVHNKERAGKQKNPVPIRSLMLTESKGLIRQNSGADGRHGLAVHAPELEVGLYYSDEKDLTKEVTVMTYASFVRAAERGIIKPKDFDVLLADEADLALSYKRFPLLKEFKKDILSYGFTATDKYNDNKHLGQLYETIIQGPNIREAIDKGLATPVQIYHVRSNQKLVLPNAAKDLAELPDKLQQDLVGRASRNQIAVDWAKMFSEKGISGLIECIRGEGCKHAYEIAEQLSDEVITDPDTGLHRRLRAEGMDGSNKRRDEILESFEAGEIDWIASVDVNKRGIDLPRAAAFIGLRDTFSLVRSTQMRGRIPRIDTRNPDKIAHFVEVHDDIVFEDGESASLPCTMTHVLGLEKFEQIAHYPPLGHEPTTTRPRENVITLEDIPESLRQMLATNDYFSSLNDSEYIGPRQEITTASTDWVSLEALKQEGLSLEWTKRIAADWKIEDKRLRSPDGRVRIHIPTDVVPDILEFHRTPKEERHQERAGFPPKTWLPARGPDAVHITEGARRILREKGVPDYALTPRMARRVRAAEKHLEKPTYYSPRQLARIQEVTNALPRKSLKNGYHQELRGLEKPKNSYEYHTLPLSSTSSMLDAELGVLDRVYTDKIEGRSSGYDYYKPQAQPSPLHQKANMVRDAYREEEVKLVKEAGLYERITIADNKNGSGYEVGNYITEEEQEALWQKVEETVPFIPDTHIPLSLLLEALKEKFRYTDQENTLQFDLAKADFDLAIFRGIQTSNWYRGPKVGLCVPKAAAARLIAQSGLSGEVVDKTIFWINTWLDGAAGNRIDY